MRPMLMELLDAGLKALIPVLAAETERRAAEAADVAEPVVPASPARYLQAVGATADVEPSAVRSS